MGQALLTAQSSSHGGIERRLLLETQVLRGLGLDVALAPSRFPGSEEWIAAMKHAGARPWRWHPYKFIERNQPSWPFLHLGASGRAALRRSDFRFAHVALAWTRVGMSRVHDLAAAGVPVVLGLHCTYPREHWDRRLDAPLQRALDGVVAAYAVSEPVRQSFIDAYRNFSLRFDISVIDNGIDLARFAPTGAAEAQGRATWGIDPQAFLIVVCGRLTSMKRPWLALDAFLAARHRDERLQLLFVGEGPELNALRRQAAASPFGHWVQFAGFVADTAPLLREADLLLSTSAAEGFALAPAEALACGVPVVLSDTASFRYAFSTCAAAMLVADDSAAGFARAIGAAAERRADTASRLSASARAFAVEHLSEDAMLARLKAFYAALLPTLVRAKR